VWVSCRPWIFHEESRALPLTQSRTRTCTATATTPGREGPDQTADGHTTVRCRPCQAGDPFPGAADPATKPSRIDRLRIEMQAWDSRTRAGVHPTQPGLRTSGDARHPGLRTRPSAPPPASHSRDSRSLVTPRTSRALINYPEPLIAAKGTEAATRDVTGRVA